jgi:hypothetical protein
MIGNQDNDGRSSVPDATSKNKYYGAQAGDGTATAVGQQNKLIRYLGGLKGPLYYDNNGFTTKFQGTPVPNPTTANGTDIEAPQVWDLKMHNSTDAILYAGYDVVYKKTNAPTGPWVKVGNWPAIAKRPEKLLLVNNTATHQRIIALDEDKEAFKTVDEVTWTVIKRPKAPNSDDDSTFNSIYASKNDWNTLFMVTPGYLDQHKVFMSTNNGTNWTNVSKILCLLRQRLAFISPESPS